MPTVVVELLLMASAPHHKWPRCSRQLGRTTTRSSGPRILETLPDPLPYGARMQAALTTAAFAVTPTRRMLSIGVVPVNVINVSAPDAVTVTLAAKVAEVMPRAERSNLSLAVLKLLILSTPEPAANLKMFAPAPPFIVSSPAPPVIVSAPGPPLMVSVPAPPLMTSAPDVPVI